MKTPQRRFVVEFKSGRRQPKAQTKSIWGNTDLKALAREVEETTPHLFNPSEAAGTLNSAETAPADPIDAEPVNQPAHDVDAALAQMPFANGAEVEISKHHEADHPPGTVVQVEKSQPASQPGTTSTGTPRKRAKRTYAQPIAHNSEVGNDDPSRRPRLSTSGSPSTSLPPWRQTTSASKGCWLNSFMHKTCNSRRCLRGSMSNSKVAPLA